MYKQIYPATGTISRISPETPLQERQCGDTKVTPGGTLESAYMIPNFGRKNFCDCILQSPWSE
ncbi:hypothetical protein [Dyadobacter sp. 50-39]|uniref:hypothetical protein n=1 Tax=Dyadobacter sp. 50-39 TaxID=1895756 RepID=UPI000B12CA9A|nr:hypothetical protein [Dyadobacter sp. 50-39]